MRSLPFVVFSFLLPMTGAVAAPGVLPFPMKTVSRTPDAVTLRLDPSAFAAVRAAGGSVVLTGLPLPDGAAVDLSLERIAFDPKTVLFAVDGFRWPEPLAADLALFSGSVVGQSDSHAFVALSRYGCRARLRVGDRLYALLVVPPATAGGRFDVSRMARDDGLLPPEIAGEWCALERLEAVRPVDTTTIPPPTKGTAGYLPLKELLLAVETDYQFYQLFNDANAAAAYALSLVGAVSDRYREQVGVIFTIPYLGLYTQNNDPWTQQDNGGSCVDVLQEFRAKWKGGNGPVPANLYTMLSGADLGCGVAWLDVLCNSEYGFSVEGNLGGGMSFPPQQGHGTWDFVVLAHELGHNFGSPHTHDFCPTPLDECAPKDYFGSCQNQQVCINNGTNMSYCHLCPGGMSNITLHFHPTVAALMRQRVDNSCLSDYVGIPLSEDLGFALPGSNGAPSLAVSWDDGQGAVVFDAQNLAPAASGLLVVSDQTLYAPFLGGTMVPALSLVAPIASSAQGGFTLAAPVPGSVHLPSGADFYAQLWIQDNGGVQGAAATNGVHFELIVP